MNNTNFIKLLKTLKQKEMTEFCKFVKKEGSEQSRDMFIFVDYLKEQYPDFRKQKMSGEYIGQKLFPETKDNVKKILTLQEKLIPILNHFKNQKLSNFVKLLKTLNRNEMNEFCKFVEGRTLKQRKDRTDFVEYLKEQHLDGFPWHKMSKEYIGQKLFPKDENNIRKVQNLQQNLMPILEDFLIYTELEKQETKRDFLLLDVYKRRKLDNLFFKKIEKIEKGWEKEKPAGIEQLHNEYLLKKLCFAHPDYSDRITNLITYEMLIDKIDQYYFAVKLFWTSCLKTTNDFVNISGEDFVERQHFIQHILNINTEDILQIKFLGELLDTLISTNFQNYHKIEQQFILNIASFEEHERNDLLDLLNHISYRNHLMGRSKYLHSAFELNRRAVESGWIFRHEYISVFRFSNIVNIACAVGELEWATYFIDEFGTSLNKDICSDIVAVSHATVDVKKGEYKKASERFEDVRFYNVLYKAHSRAIQLQCYYELRDSDNFLDLAPTFTKFLKNQQKRNLADDSTKAFLNFVGFTSKLEKLPEYKPKVDELLRDIRACNKVFYKNWLIEKAEELKK